MTDDMLMKLLGENAALFAAFKKWSDGQVMLLAGTTTDPESFNKDGGRDGALGYYPVINVNDQTIYVPCIARLAAIALGGANAETLDGLIAVTGEKLAAVDAATTAATTQAASAETQAARAKAQADAIGDIAGAREAAVAAAGRAEAAKDMARSVVSDLTGTSVVGEPAVVASVTTSAAQTFIFDQAVPQSGRIATIRVGLVPSATARVLKLRRYTKAGITFTPVADSMVAVPVVAGYQSIAVNIPVKAGEYIGAYTGAEGLSYSSQQVGAAAYWHAAGEVVGATDFVRVGGGDVRLQLGLDLSFVIASDDRLKAVEQRATTALDRAAVVEGVADSAYGIADGVSAAMRATQTVGRPAAEGVVSTGVTAADTVWVLAQPAEGAGYIRTVRFALAAASPAAGSPITIQRWSRVGNTFTRVSQKTVTGYPGINALPIGLKIAKGDFVGIYAGGQRLSYTAGSGIPYFNAASGAGNVATFDDAADSGTTVRLECSFDIDYFPVTAATAVAVDAAAAKAQLATAAIGDIGAAAPVPIYTRGRNSSGSWVAGTNFRRWRVGVLGSSLPVAKRVTQWTVTAQLPVEVATVHAMLYARPVDANVGATSMAADVPVWATEAVIPRAAIAAGTGFVDVTFVDPAPFVPDPAKAYAVRFYARDASGVETFIGCAQAAGGGDQFERGFYNTGTSDAGWVAIGGTLSVALRVDTTAYQVRKEALPADVGSAVLPDLLMTPVVTLTAPAALSVTVAGTVRKNGTGSAVGGTIAFPAAASGKDRVDLIVMDRLSLALSRVAGTERPALTDSIEYIPAVPAGSVLIARAQVSETKAIAVNCSLFRGLIKVGSEAEMEAHIRRNMSLTRRTRGKAMRGAAIKLGGYGDSITAQQGGGIPGFEANGNSRDRIGYLGVYPTDTRARVAQYDFGRGVTDNTKIGWNWRIKEALDALAGAEVVTYLNFGIGGTTSGATDPGDGRVNGLHPGRLAVPLAAGLDLVVIAFGMNERGSGATYGNLVDMARQFLAVGTEVALIGCPRPGTSYAGTSSAAWRYTCDAIEAAAMDAGAAYISTAAIADDRNLGAMGLPAEALGATNISVAANHPGVVELLQYGRGCVGQLGL